MYPKELLFLSRLVILTKFAENKWYGYLENATLENKANKKEYEVVDSMDTKYSHLVQVGEVNDKITIYFEDYAYTYFKKNQKEDKLYLYGKIKKEEEKTEIYIYGISLFSKLEKTYFKEYEKVGAFRTGEEKLYWLGENKEEILVTGYYIFYSSNKAMQEYLIDQAGEQNENNQEEGLREKKKIEEIPIREVLLTKSYGKYRKKEHGKNVSLIPALAVAAAIGVVFLSGKEDTQEKIEVFRQIVSENVKGIKTEIPQLTIEEKIMEDIVITEETTPEENREIEEQTDSPVDRKKIQEDTKENSPIIIEETVFMKDEEEINKQGEQEERKEYIVQEGDTLAGICKKFYGTTDNIEEICRINEITNQDYIAPGQKLYLPK